MGLGWIAAAGATAIQACLLAGVTLQLLVEALGVEGVG